MVIRTPAVGAATTPVVVKTFFSHYLTKRSKKRAARAAGQDDPSAQELSYDEGIRVIRAFLDFAAKHTLEELQAFTATSVPTPSWVRKTVVTIPREGAIDRAEELLEKHLESYGDLAMERLGGRNWWKVRGRELEAEWIEMKRDFIKRKAAEAINPEEAARSERVMLYVHGGAYFFSSLDTHRYQIQRHARKLGGRAFAPSYRLAPQYPFPCGLLDCLAAYLYLIQPPLTADHAPIHPSCIILAGDSAGGGCVLSLLIVIRELGLPMPAGADLLSPWVDLTHSFPSIMTNAHSDYIPGDGFHFRPSLGWCSLQDSNLVVENDRPGGEPVVITEQIQLYCPNVLLTHPLVSPINQGSLGGLCPVLVHSGGGELLRDEQIYLAHKLANPSKYPPSSQVLQDYPGMAPHVAKYRPTRTQLQVYDGCAHVIPTLSITIPAKYMYRSAANFNIWALSTAQRKAARRPQASRIPSFATNGSAEPSTNGDRPPRIQSSSASSMNGERAAMSDASQINGSGANGEVTRAAMDEKLHRLVNEEPVAADDIQSESSSDSSSDGGNGIYHTASPTGTVSAGAANEKITVLGSIPAFGPDNIIRQRVSYHGYIRPMEPEAEVEALRLSPDNVGRVHIDGPISKWLEKRKHYENKYHKDLEKFREIKERDYDKAKQHGFLTRQLHGETPPPCALASFHDRDVARAVAKSVDEPPANSNPAVMLYMRMSQKPDEEQAGNITDASLDALKKEQTRQEEGASSSS